MRKSHLEISNSLFSRSYSTIIYSYLYEQNIQIKNTVFKLIQQSAIFLSSGESVSSFRSHCYFSDKILLSQPKNGQLILKNVNVNGKEFPSKWTNRRPTFFEQNGYTCGNKIIIAGSLFKNCNSKDQGGGGLHIEQDCYTIIHETIFESCCTSSLCGAAVCICKKLSIISFDKSEQSKDTNIQYCCFQNCNSLIENTTFGVSLMAASINITLFYASTNNCSYIRAAGALFDVQSDSTNSKYVNTTGGNAHYCSAIEYRFATKGYFIFQTVFNMTSKYLVAFVQAVPNDISVSHCNFVSNRLYESFKHTIKLPTVVYIAQHFIRIKYFYFVKTKFVDNIGYYVNRNGDTAKAEMVNCYSDDKNQNRYNKEYVTYKNCKFGTGSFTTYVMEHLYLGDCRGTKTADIIIISPTFSASSIFSPSSRFSNSIIFSCSKYFTNSILFSKSEDFTQSFNFSNSFVFSESDDFSVSKQFSNSISFSFSKLFTKSNVFSQSDDFSYSFSFSESDDFTFSDPFEKSNIFTNSIIFSKSDAFSKSEIFSQSFNFSNSFSFSESDDFSFSNQFSDSIYFSYSQLFTKSEKFTKSNVYSKSCDFTHSLLFTKSNKFQDTHCFSPSFEFQNSQLFSESNVFSQSAKFTNTHIFTNSQFFTKSNTFKRPDIFKSNQQIILKDVTFSRSYSIVFVTRKSVSFSFSCSSSNMMLFTYLNEIGSFGYTQIQTISYYFLPYIIKILSQSYTVSYVPFPIYKRRCFTAGQLIALICGSASIFFFTLGIIIFIIQKEREKKSALNYDLFSSSDDEKFVHVEKETEQSIQRKLSLQLSTDDDDLNFWL